MSHLERKLIDNGEKFEIKKLFDFFFKKLFKMKSKWLENVI
jgi:hypothetical protein